MSGRFVRASKFRHVHGQEEKKVWGLSKPILTKGDADNLACSNKYIAYSSSGGGGPVTILNATNEPSRVPTNPPTLNVHKTAVVDLAFSPFNGQLLATGADNGTLCVTLLPDPTGITGPAGLAENITKPSAEMKGHSKKVTFVRWHPVANNILASLSADKSVRIWDASQQAQMSEFKFGDVLPQSFDWNYDGSKAYVRSQDKVVRIFDPRTAHDCASAEVNQVAGPQGAKLARVCAMDEKNFLVVGHNARALRQIQVFDERKLGSALYSHDLDQSAGVCHPHYDRDINVLYLVGKGDANIRYFEITDNIYFLNEFRSTISTKAACWLPKRYVDVTSCEIAHCFRGTSDKVTKVSFQVPRKSDMFQEDIFPDTYAGLPGMESKDYLAGENKAPASTSMDPSQRSDQPEQAATFTASASPAELQAKIAELEALVAKQAAEIEALKKAAA